MSRELGQRQAMLAQDSDHLVAVAFTFRRSLQIEKPPFPGRNLHTLVAETGRPTSDRVQAIERCVCARELRQKYRRPFNAPHAYHPVSLKAPRPLPSVTGPPPGRNSAL